MKLNESRAHSPAIHEAARESRWGGGGRKIRSSLKISNNSEHRVPSIPVELRSTIDEESRRDDIGIV